MRGIGKFTIPQDGSVTNIADYAFYKNTDIENIHIPVSVISMNETAFSYTTNLKIITADINAFFCINDNCLVDIKEGKIIAVGVNCHIPMDEYITTIEMDVFADKVGIKEIYIPKNITKIVTPYQLTNCQLENISVSPENKFYTAKNNCLIEKDKYSEEKA